MGIEFEAVGVFTPGRQGLLKRRPPVLKLVEEAASAVLEEMISDPIVARCVGTMKFEDGVCIGFDALNGSIELVEADEGRLVAGSKTSTAGPGFHAFAIDLVARIGEHLGVVWDWTYDEAGVAGPGCDFSVLQQAHAQFLRYFAQAITGHPVPTSGIAVNYPVSGCKPAMDVFSFTPHGPVTRDEWTRIAEASEEESHDLAAAFFPWWNQDFDARFYRSIGRFIFWTTCPWRACRNDEERALCQCALDAFARARELDPGIDVPEAEIAELEHLLTLGVEDTAAPNPDGVGYRRGLMHHHYGPWRIAIPGHMAEWYEEEQSAIVHGVPGFFVYLTPLRHPEPAETGVQSADDLMAQIATQAPEACQPLATFERGSTIGAALCGLITEEEDPDSDEPESTYFHLAAAVVRGPHMLLMSIDYLGDENHALAEQIFQSIECGDEPDET
jgi:hypothetical protein